MHKTLKNCLAGENVIVERLEGQGAVRRRILDMGITPGAHLYIRKMAPLGDPLEVTVRGYELTLRKEDANCIVIQ